MQIEFESLKNLGTTLRNIKRDSEEVKRSLNHMIPGLGRLSIGLTSGFAGGVIQGGFSQAGLQQGTTNATNIIGSLIGGAATTAGFYGGMKGGEYLGKKAAEAAGKGIGAIAGRLSGAATGAKLGARLGPWGALGGTIVGGVIGAEGVEYAKDKVSGLFEDMPSDADNEFANISDLSEEKNNLLKKASEYYYGRGPKIGRFGIREDEGQPSHWSWRDFVPFVDGAATVAAEDQAKKLEEEIRRRDNDFEDKVMGFSRQQKRNDRLFAYMFRE